MMLYQYSLFRKEQSQGRNIQSIFSTDDFFFLVLKYFLLVESIDVKPEGIEDKRESKNTLPTLVPGTIPMFQGFVGHLGIYLV